MEHCIAPKIESHHPETTDLSCVKKQLTLLEVLEAHKGEVSYLSAQRSSVWKPRLAFRSPDTKFSYHNYRFKLTKRQTEY